MKQLLFTFNTFFKKKSIYREMSDDPGTFSILGKTKISGRILIDIVPYQRHYFVIFGICEGQWPKHSEKK